MRVQGIAYRSGGGHVEGIPLPKGKVKYAKRKPVVKAPPYPRVVDAPAVPPKPRPKFDERHTRGSRTVKVWTRAETDAVLADYQAGMSINDVARKHKRSTLRVRAAILAAGIEIRGPKHADTTPKACVVCSHTFSLREGVETPFQFNKRSTCCGRCSGILAARTRRKKKIT